MPSEFWSIDQRWMTRIYATCHDAGERTNETSKKRKRVAYMPRNNWLMRMQGLENSTQNPCIYEVAQCSERHKFVLNHSRLATPSARSRPPHV